MKNVIYSITNSITGDQYIGSTLNFNKRRDKHVSDLVKNKHHSSYLQNSWNKYGQEAFFFDVIECVLDKRDLISREQYWIDNLDPSFNMCKIASSPLGVIRSQETREKIRKANIGKKWSEESIAKRSKSQSKENHYLFKKTMNDEAKKKISDKLKTRYKSNPSPRIDKLHSTKSREKISESVKNYYKDKPGPYNGKTHKEKSKEKIRKKLEIQVDQYDTNGIYIRSWESIKSATEGLGINHISSCCKGKCKTAGGFIWRYKNNEK